MFGVHAVGPLAFKNLSQNRCKYWSTKLTFSFSRQRVHKRLQAFTNNSQYCRCSAGSTPRSTTGEN